MQQRLTQIPSDEQVRRLLFEAGKCADPRAHPALCLLLANTLSLGRLSRLEWTNWDRVAKCLVIPRGSKPAVTIAVTNLLARMLNAIPQRGSREIFASNDKSASRLEVLFTHLLARSGLGSYVVADLLAWSELQTPVVRFSTIN